MNKSAQEAVVASLDEIYSSLVKQAELLKEAFFETALALHQGKRGHVPIVIMIKQSSPNAVSIFWAKVTVTRATPSQPKKGFLLTTINKGPGHKYRVSAFEKIQNPLKGVVRAYENQLAEIREACTRNREIRRLMIPHVKKTSIIEATVKAFITDDYQATSE